MRLFAFDTEMLKVQKRVFVVEAFEIIQSR